MEDKNQQGLYGRPINFCFSCKKIITFDAKRCRMCEGKNRQGENHPNFGKIADKNPNWKRGRPKCINCGQQLVNYKAKRCRECWAGTNHPKWKGGVSLNRELATQKMKEYRQQNHEKYRKSVNAYRQQLKIVNPSYKIMENLRRRINRALGSIRKSKHTIELIGCSVEQLWQHLENQFQPGMTRENHGYYGWHIDHIKPLALFDLSDPKQQRQAFHFTNLQPLWAAENLQKWKKYELMVS